MFPPVPGTAESAIDTPALLLDLDAFDHNLDRMAQVVATAGVALRPHAKTHKCPVIAHRQIARGAVGQCVQKVSEAEAMAWAGVGDLLVSNEVVGEEKLARLAALARICTIAICVDDAFQIEQLENAAARADVRITALVEIDAGSGRCGVEPGEPAAELARKTAASGHLDFGGLQAYHGNAQHRRTLAERRAAIDGAASRARETIAALDRIGIKCPKVTGGGTGTFELEAASGVYTELQAGSYVFMDADYGRNLDEGGAPVSMFRQSLFVLSTVMSAARGGRAVLDAGHKCLPTDSGMPGIWQRPGVTYLDASDEHGKLDIAPGVAAPKLGEKLRLVPGHCDPTVSRFDWLVCTRGGRVECVWPITARGAVS